MTRNEVATQMVNEQMTIEDYAKVKVCQNLLKNMIKTITLLVAQIKSGNKLNIDQGLNK